MFYLGCIMSSLPIPENASMNPFSPLAPSLFDPKGVDFLSWLFDELPQAQKSVSETEILELKRLMEDLGEKIPSSQVDSEKGALESPVRGAIYQGLIHILKQLYKDPMNPAYAPLIRFIGERKILMKEVLTLIISEKREEAPITGRNLGSIILRVVEWQTQQKEGSSSYLLGEKLLNAIHTKEIASLTDLKPWIEANIIKNPSNRAFLPPADLRSFFAALDLEIPVSPVSRERFSSRVFGQALDAPPLQLLEQVYEKAVLYVQKSYVFPEIKEFFQTLLLPHLEQSVAQMAGSPPEQFSEMEEKPMPAVLREEIALLNTADGKTIRNEALKPAIEHFFQYMAESLKISKEEVQNLFRQLPGMLEFPVIGPYLASIRLSLRFSASRTQFEKPSCIEVLEDEDAEETLDDEEDEKEEDEEEEFCGPSQ